MRKKVFISHNHQDKPFVKRLAAFLMSNNIECWIDESEINIGDSLIEKISEAIHDLDSVIAVISYNSIDSNWVRRELDWAMTKEIQNNKVVILPVVIDQCDIPFFLANKLYADFTNKNKFEENSQRLLKAIKKEKNMSGENNEAEPDIHIGESSNINYKSTLIPIYLSLAVILLSIFGLIATQYFFQTNTYIENRDFINSNISVFWILLIALMFGEIIRVLLAQYQAKIDHNFATEAGLINITSIFSSRYREVIKNYWNKPLVKVVVYIEIVILIGIVMLINYAVEIIKIAIE